MEPRVSIIHEGIDTERIKPDPSSKLKLPNGRVLDGSTPVITFINRCFEPLRGYHIFMRALPKVLACVPDAEVVLIGGDERGGYGLRPPAGTTWKARFLQEVEPQLDMARVHFTGLVPHSQMLTALCVSSAHVYYTYPFALSHSLLEAMACEALVVCSDTVPLHGVVEHEANGLLLDFFDVDALAEALVAACRQPQAYRHLRRRARQTILERFDRKRHGEPRWLRLAESLAGGDAPKNARAHNETADA